MGSPAPSSTECIRNPGLVVKWARKGKVPSNVSSAAIPPTERTLLIRAVCLQDLLQAHGEQELNRDVTVIDPSGHLASKDGKAVLHRVDVSTKLASDLLEVSALDQVALQGWQGPWPFESSSSLAKTAV